MTSETEEAVPANEVSSPGDFYSEALTEAERIELPKAEKIEGFDQEIAVLRVRLRTALKEQKENIPLMLRGFDLLVKRSPPAIVSRNRPRKTSLPAWPGCSEASVAC